MKKIDSKTVIVVGSGLSGICMGIALQRLGIDYLILEKSNDIAGTWSQNLYPGCGCDIPMFAYCYSFELFQGDPWPKQPEILKYFKHCVEKYKIAENIQFSAAVKHAVFDKKTALWNLELDDSRQFTARFVVNATGQLGNANIPRFPGMDSFKGTIVHSAKYPPNLDLDKKKVAIIGSGATSLQLVEALQGKAKELLVFSRSPKYIYPRVKYSPITIEKMKKDSSYWQQVREQFIDSQDQYRVLLDDHPQFDPFKKDSLVRAFYAQSTSTNLDSFTTFYDWMTERNMRPDYPTGCSRPLASNTFHDDIRASNVTLVGEAINSFNEQSIITSGQEYPVDIVILATGFALDNLAPPYLIRNAHGIALSEAWENFPDAYLGMATRGYPNLFFLYGPNTNTNSTSVTFFVESQVNYISQIIEDYINSPFETIEVKIDRLKEYSEWLLKKSQNSSEASSCSTWYQNKQKINISTFPGGFREYEKLTKKYTPSDYDIIYARQPTESSTVSDLHAISKKLVELFSLTTLLPVTEIELSVPLRNYPLDSILIVDFIRRINEYWSLKLEPVLFFDHANLQELSNHLMALSLESKSLPDTTRKLLPLQEEPRQAIIPAIPEEQIRLWKNNDLSQTNAHPVGKQQDPITIALSGLEPVAIVGANGYFPESPDLETFWNNLVNGKDCISVIPESRWDWQTYYGEPQQGDKTRVKWGGFIEGVELFDPLFFKISPKEAELMDPQHRLFLQCSWELLEGAGYNPDALSGRKIGVFLGINLNDYAELVTQALGEYDVLQISGLMHLFGANRLSFLLGLTGPSEVIDTACSSSLVAIHRAVQAIHNDGCEMVIAGGSNLILNPKMHLLYSKAGMLSEDGKCKTFSSAANGYVRGEGVAAVLLKPLSKAEADGDTILGIIRGSAENHGGKANSLTAPNPKLQARLIEEAMLQAKVDPRTVGYIECHGTGTALGDPIEINGIKRAYQALYEHYHLPQPEHPHCALGSVKSNIGHLETAAGIAGVIKVLLCFKHHYLPKTLHAIPRNSQIHLDSSPFYVVEEGLSWNPIIIDGIEQPRRAGVSSFGAGGSNAHIILEEYKNAVFPDVRKNPAPILLSAGNHLQLQQKARDLLDFIQSSTSINSYSNTTDIPRLDSIAYTLQTGRQMMEERLGFVVDSLDQLTAKLRAYVDGQKNIDGLFHGNIKNRESLSLFDNDSDLKEILGKWASQGKFSQLLELWVKGIDFDWHSLYIKTTETCSNPKRIWLPTYPFAKQKYWIGLSTDKKSVVANSVRLHPLLHINVSNFHQQAYRNFFDGGEFFLRDHKIRINNENSTSVLPAAAYLEMIRSALHFSLPEHVDTANFEIRNIIWVRPFIVNEKKQIDITLLAQEEGIYFEIFSEDSTQRIIHCKGEAIIRDKLLSQKLDVGQFRQRMTHTNIMAQDIYPAFAKMGFDYGVTHQSLISLDIGKDELLANIRLPEQLGSNQLDYWLHPSLMDAALQACNGLIINFKQPGNSLFLPFAMENVHIVSPFASEMIAWVRFSANSGAGNPVIKFDIDLYDNRGNLCLSVNGFSVRILDGNTEIYNGDSRGNGLHSKIKAHSSAIHFDDVFYKNVIASLLDNKISVDEAVELG